METARPYPAVARRLQKNPSTLHLSSVIPAKAGIQGPHVRLPAARPWIPAFAGMTIWRGGMTLERALRYPRFALRLRKKPSSSPKETAFPKDSKLPASAISFAV